MGVILLVGAAIFAAGLAAYFYKRKQAAEAKARRSNRTLTDLMAANLMLQQSSLASYKAMLRPCGQQSLRGDFSNPAKGTAKRPSPTAGGGIDWEYVADDRPRRF